MLAHLAHYSVRSPRARVAYALALCGLLALVAVPGASQARSHLGRSRARVRGRVSYVSGRLDAPHYTVLVVGYNGRIAFSAAQRFRIAAPDSHVTLQLVDKSGRYAGPVVFGTSPSRVITGIKVPANLGTIDVLPAQGYARVAHRLAHRLLDRSRWAYALHGVPIGNGRNLGLVRSRGKGGGAGPGQDEAHTGIPNELDIAVPGTKILKSLAPSALATRAAHASAHNGRLRGAIVHLAAVEAPPASGSGTPPAGAPAGEGAAPAASPAGGSAGTAGPSAGSPWMSQMFLEMNETVNEDAAGVSLEEINSTLQRSLNLKLLDVPSGVERLELDCNGLSFCSQGGSGQAELEGLPQNAPGFGAVPFPGSALDPASGFGELIGPAAPSGLLGSDANGAHEFSLNPNATSAQIGSGDVITLLETAAGATTALPTAIDFVFNTVPAIAAWSDSAGDSGTISYPDTSGLGTFGNPIKVAAGPNGDVVMSFTVYRPQRQGIPGAGEPPFMDIGHLGYTIDYASAPTPDSTAIGSTAAPQCPASSYSDPSPTLTLETGSGGGELKPPPGDGMLIDSAEDTPASAANTISFSVDLTQCLAAKGISSLPIGQPVAFDLSANSQSSHDHANQKFVLERVR